jgi:hypothetical protein
MARCSGSLSEDVQDAWETEIVGSHDSPSDAYDAKDSAVGYFNWHHKGPEIVIVTEIGPAFDIFASEDSKSGTSPRRTIWDDGHNVEWVTKIADVEPPEPGRRDDLWYRYQQPNHDVA